MSTKYRSPIGLRDRYKTGPFFTRSYSGFSAGSSTFLYILVDSGVQVLDSVATLPLTSTLIDVLSASELFNIIAYLTDSSARETEIVSVNAAVIQQDVFSSISEIFPAPTVLAVTSTILDSLIQFGVTVQPNIIQEIVNVNPQPGAGASSASLLDVGGVASDAIVIVTTVDGVALLTDVNVQLSETPFVWEDLGPGIRKLILPELRDFSFESGVIPNSPSVAIIRVRKTVGRG